MASTQAGRFQILQPRLGLIRLRGVPFRLPPRPKELLFDPRKPDTLKVGYLYV